MTFKTLCNETTIVKIFYQYSQVIAQIGLLLWCAGAFNNYTSFYFLLQDDDVASISNNGHLAIHRIRHPEKDLPPLEGASGIRDFASSIKVAKRREINKLQSTIEEVRPMKAIQLYVMY